MPSRLVNAFGETKCVLDWSKDDRCVVYYDLLKWRIRSEWDPEEAITSPIDAGKKRRDTRRNCDYCDESYLVISNNQRFCSDYCNKNEARRRSIEKDVGNTLKQAQAYKLKGLYGITVDDFDRMFSEQDGKCVICFVDITNKYCIDHNHETGKVRGLLCFNCNTGLGHFKDDEILLMNAIIYLKERGG